MKRGQTSLEDFSLTVEKLEEKGRFSLELPGEYFPHYKSLSKKIDVEFYPYRLLRSTIRENNGRYLIRLSDMLEDAPDEVNSALCWMLLLRIQGKKTPPELNRIYRGHAYSDAMEERIKQRRKEKGAKRMGPARGEAYDLEEIFDRLNREYFAGELKRPRLGFSLRRTRTRWGHYDPDIHSITVSRTLDAGEVPAYVVDYIMFHEMLHIVHDMKKRRGRRVFHHREFRKDEERFPGSREAQKWLQSLAGALRKRRTQRRKTRRQR